MAGKRIKPVNRLHLVTCAHHFIETPNGSLSICLDSIAHSGEAIDRQINSTQAKPDGK
jgi:hypothetical protein